VTGVLMTALAGVIAGCSSNGAQGQSSQSAGGDASSGKPLNFSFSFQEGTTSGLLFYVAKDEGFFADEGINVSMIPTSAQTGTLVAGIASGSLDGALTALATVATTRQTGVNVKLQGAFLLTDRILIIPNGSSIPKASGRDITATMKALSGKTVGVPGIGGALTLELKALLTSAHVDPNSVHFIDVEPGTTAVAAFKSHTVDAAYEAPVTAQEVEAAGLGSQAMAALENGPAEYGNSLLIGAMVSDQFLSANPDFSSRFQAAMAKAVNFAKDPANLDKLVTICTDNGVAQFSGLKANLQASQFVTTVSTGTADQVLGFMKSAAIVKATPALAPAEIIAAASLG
jgi:NitT/TauT family transport system substrate-binding protein